MLLKVYCKNKNGQSHKKEDLSKIFFKNGLELVMQWNLNINELKTLQYTSRYSKLNKDSNHAFHILRKIPYILSFAEW